MVPKASTYRVVAHFENQQLGSCIMEGSIMQGAESYPLRIIYTGQFLCDADCYVEGIVNDSNSVNLQQGLATLMFTGLTYINISLVSKHAEKYTRYGHIRSLCLITIPLYTSRTTLHLSLKHFTPLLPAVTLHPHHFHLVTVNKHCYS